MELSTIGYPKSFHLGASGEVRVAVGMFKEGSKKALSVLF